MWSALAIVTAVVGIHSCHWEGAYHALRPVATVETTGFPMMEMWVQRANCSERALRITDGNACTWLYLDTGKLSKMLLPCRKDDDFTDFKQSAFAESGYVAECSGIAIPRLGISGGLFGGRERAELQWGHFGTYRLVYVRNGVRRVLLERHIVNSTDTPRPEEIAWVDPCGELIVCEAWERNTQRYLWVFATHRETRPQVQ